MANKKTWYRALGAGLMGGVEQYNTNRKQKLEEQKAASLEALRSRELGLMGERDAETIRHNQALEKQSGIKVNSEAANTAEDTKGKGIQNKINEDYGAPTAAAKLGEIESGIAKTYGEAEQIGIDNKTRGAKNTADIESTAANTALTKARSKEVHGLAESTKSYQALAGSAAMANANTSFFRAYNDKANGERELELLAQKQADEKSRTNAAVDLKAMETRQTKEASFYADTAADSEKYLSTMDKAKRASVLQAMQVLGEEGLAMGDPAGYKKAMANLTTALGDIEGLSKVERDQAKMFMKGVITRYKNIYEGSTGDVMDRNISPVDALRTGRSFLSPERDEKPKSLDISDLIEQGKQIPNEAWFVNNPLSSPEIASDTLMSLVLETLDPDAAGVGIGGKGLLRQIPFLKRAVGGGGEDAATVTAGIEELISNWDKNIARFSRGYNIPEGLTSDKALQIIKEKLGLEGENPQAGLMNTDGFSAPPTLDSLQNMQRPGAGGGLMG